LLNGKIYQLTYREHKVFVYDTATFKKTGEFEWPYEGWGMTNDGKHLILDTGGSILYFVDPATFKILNQVSVNNNYGPVSKVNELEYVDNFIFANVYETDNILKIDPQNGNVVGVLDMSGLLQKSGMNVNPQNYTANTGNVLNGIAYDSAKNNFFVTGKLWPALFEIKLNN
jgi:glutamine cyclotransferase